MEDDFYIVGEDDTEAAVEPEANEVDEDTVDDKAKTFIKTIKIKVK